MTDLLIRNVRADVLDWLKAEAAASGRTLSEQTAIVLREELAARRAAPASEWVLEQKGSHD